MDDDAMRALVAKWWGMWGPSSDGHEIAEICADPYIRHTGMGSERVSLSDYRSRVKRTRAVLRDAVTTIDDQVVAGDRVWTRATSRGVNLTSIDNAVITWIVIHRIADGRIAETWAATVHGVEWKQLG